jgi:GNAT superfamily N-acetyltransferase
MPDRFDQFAKRLTFTKAQPRDLDFYIDLLEEVAEWLHGRGVSPLPRGIYRESMDYYSGSIAHGEVYFASLGEDVVGTLRLVSNDGVVWPEADDAALYLENLVVSREWTGRGLGRQMLAWAEEQSVGTGKPCLRLDCFASNVVLRKYYEDAGYTGRDEVDAVYPFGTLRLQRYEKHLSL